MKRKTRVVPIDPDHPDPTAMEEAAAILRDGGLVAFPTETVYGLGADATNPEAIATIYEAKGRPSNNPLILHASRMDMARRCVRGWSLREARLAARFWPGPLTMVLPRSSIVPDAATAGRDTVGIRIPSNSIARSLIGAADRPIAAPSANRSTGISPTRAEHVLRDLDGRVDMILDGGPTRFGIESTVLDLTCMPARLLRPGMLTLSELEDGLQERIEVPSGVAEGPEAYSSPGQMAVHYAPRTSSWRSRPENLDRDVTDRYAPFGLLVLGRPELASAATPAIRVDLTTAEQAARELYATLHEWDQLGLSSIHIVVPPDGEEWRAVRDRVWRETGFSKGDASGSASR